MPCKLCYVVGVCGRVCSGMGGPDDFWLSRIDKYRIISVANAREILYELPFGNLTDFDLENS